MNDRSNWLAGVFRRSLSGLEPSWRQALQTPTLSVLVLLLLAQLVAALVLASHPLRPTAADAPLLALRSDQVTQIEIRSADDQVLLARTSAGWTLPALADFPADADKVEQLLQSLMDLQRPLPVGTSREAQQRLKVADDNAERTISLASDEGDLVTLLTGDAPGFHRLFARLAGEEAIYDLPLASFQIASGPDDWVRRDQLRLDAETIERIRQDDWTLKRVAGNWQLDTGADSVQTKLDQAEMQALLSRIANLSYQGVRMASSIGIDQTDTAGAEETDSLSRPILSLEIGLDDGTTLSRTLYASDHGDYLLQTGTDPLLYELSEYNLEGLLELAPAQLMGTDAGASAAMPAPPSTPESGDTQEAVPETEVSDPTGHGT
ncbi:MAG: hypothetical protein C1943_16945 [Halochromatium sp.]|nr:hypothetical protein [Halochromatium sp.]